MFRLAVLAALIFSTLALAQPPQQKPSDELIEEEKAVVRKGIGVSAAGVAFIALISLAFQMIPIGIAFSRGHQNAWAITALSILLGCTCIGWIVAVIWSLTAVQPRGPRRPESPEWPNWQ